ncbi:MAG: DUF1338 domain-containing protein [Desulfobulbaceae bacterium]|nr:DUF1338 domain-containing protein [Candidatus Kapabacteria bacterium]MBS3999820.1 DUF1338 domain-containing protein [Desulfobulbaceae bacterium]
MTLDNVLSKLWKLYTSQNESARKVYELFTSEGETVINDHIAFRTFDNPKINVQALGKIFTDLGYREMRQYDFPEKKLNAKHYENTENENAPLIFISELRTSEFSDFLQSTVHDCVMRIEKTLIESGEIVYSGNVWGKPSHQIYQNLLRESEYAAWLYYNGFCANHFTVSVNNLKKYDSLEKVNQLLKDNGFKLNDAGGEIKGNPTELLEQSSIKADIFLGDFVEGEFEITGCYYEFAKRYKSSQGELFKGFIAKSADKIFESTNKG